MRGLDIGAERIEGAEGTLQDCKPDGCGEVWKVKASRMGRFILTQMVSVAELEAGLTSQRTKAALAAAKARGTKLGGYRGFTVNHAEGLEARRKAAAEFKARLAPELEAIRSTGAHSLNAIAGELNRRGVKRSRSSAACCLVI